MWNAVTREDGTKWQTMLCVGNRWEELLLVLTVNSFNGPKKRNAFRTPRRTSKRTAMRLVRSRKTRERTRPVKRRRSIFRDKFRRHRVILIFDFQRRTVDQPVLQPRQVYIRIFVTDYYGRLAYGSVADLCTRHVPLSTIKYPDDRHPFALYAYQTTSVVAATTPAVKPCPSSAVDSLITAV